MDQFGPILDTTLKLYGLPGVIIAVQFLAIRALWTKYNGVMESRVKDGVDMAVAIERMTQAIESLRELIKERRP